MDQIILKHKAKIINFFGLFLIIMFIYFLFTFIIPFFLPFFVGMLVAAINSPFVKIFEKIFKLKRKIAVIVAMLLTTCLLGLILFFGMLNIYNELLKLQENLSTYYFNTKLSIGSYIDKVVVYYNNLPPSISNSIAENLKNLEIKAQGLLGAAISWILDSISSAPKVILFIVVTTLSAYFFSSDSRRIKAFIMRQLPHKIEKNIEGFRADALKAFIGYIKSTFILMGVTCLEVTFALLLIGANYAVLMGFIVGVAELIPLFGTGIIMIPWIIWNLILGDTFMAGYIFIIFIVGVVIRQLLEPKIIGDKLGLHPLATLFSMYLGLQILGFIGLFVGPFTVIILKSVQKSGLLKVWND